MTVKLFFYDLFVTMKSRPTSQRKNRTKNPGKTDRAVRAETVRRRTPLNFNETVPKRFAVESNVRRGGGSDGQHEHRGRRARSVNRRSFLVFFFFFFFFRNFSATRFFCPLIVIAHGSLHGPVHMLYACACGRRPTHKRRITNRKRQTTVFFFL